MVFTDLFVSAPECLSIKNGDSPYSGKVSIVNSQIDTKFHTETLFRLFRFRLYIAERLSFKFANPNCFQAADIWSLGVTLYCLVFGKLPFHDDNIVVIYNKIRTQQLQVFVC